mmetsp:Transcript_9899/g.12862  ORF Transcript_9899/g.12862 Transcript_9899/m.12862 type:complete len:245 (-) Transcript_9899:2347-3081(-)
MPRGGRRGNNFTKKIRAPRTFAFDIPSIQPEVYKAIEQTLEFNEQQRRRKEEEEQKNLAHLAKKRKLEDASVRGEEEKKEKNVSDGVHDKSLSKNDETFEKSDDAVEDQEAGVVENKYEGHEIGVDRSLTEKDDRIGSEEDDKMKEDDKTTGEELSVNVDKLTSAHLEELKKEKSELEAKCQEDEKESTKLKSEVDKLNNTKSQMVWLMKQVITLEAKRKAKEEIKRKAKEAALKKKAEAASSK